MVSAFKASVFNWLIMYVWGSRLPRCTLAIARELSMCGVTVLVLSLRFVHLLYYPDRKRKPVV